MTRRPHHLAPAALLGLLLSPFAAAQAVTAPTSAPAAALEFRVTYDASIADTFSGRVYVMTSVRTNFEPRFGPSWFQPQPFFALDVTAWRSGEPLVIDDGALAFPGPISTLEAGTYAVQAVMRLNTMNPDLGTAPGNAFSAKVVLDLDASSSGAVDLHIDQVGTDERPSIESDRIKVVKLPSRLLSEFRGREVVMHAAVILPLEYDPSSDRRYPAYYWIGGFGSDHRSARRMLGPWDATGRGDRIVRIVLDPRCYGGHHTFADSANNGPVGKALVTELIPHLERTLPLIAAPTARFVSGHSSGGWASLWLQVAYPDFFGGTWSLAPDPVDFRDFQQIDLYADGANMYRDASGSPRPLARQGEQVMIWYEPFARMEHVYGEGGQLRSFEWVFSPRGPHGLPLPLYNRDTGAVHHDVAKAWEAYDIRLTLERHWTELGPKLAGKIHVIGGGLDTFYLDGAARNLATTLADLGSDAVVEIIPDADHGSFATIELRTRIDDELLTIFEKHHPKMETDG